MTQQVINLIKNKVITDMNLQAFDLIWRESGGNSKTKITPPKQKNKDLKEYMEKEHNKYIVCFYLFS